MLTENKYQKNEFMDKIYSLIDTQDKKYGKYKKCEFHIHTPASDCYRFIKCNGDDNEDLEGKAKFKDLSLKEVIEYSAECGFLLDYEKKELEEHIEEYKSDEYKAKLIKKRIPFESLKEYIAYMTIAHKLYSECIEVAVISDHNTTKGYTKLLYALDKYYKERCFNIKVPRIELILGVEISCSDKNHLMIIYDNKNIDKLNKYLEEILMDEKLGTYLDTRKVIEDLESHNAITYIAHVNSSDLFGSKAYKKALFNRKGLAGFGFTNLSSVKSKKDVIKTFTDNLGRFAIVYEGDSHAINEIGKKNCWIKLSKINFKSISKAFLNHNICICNYKPKKSSKYIKGIAIDPGEDGFLIEHKNNGMCVINFSTDLNCIIGGRGTGKSTILNLLEIMFSQQTDNLQTLEFISKHKIIYTSFCVDDKEYFMKFICQNSNRILGNNQSKLLPKSYSKEKKSNGDFYYKLKPHWYELYEIKKVNGDLYYKRVQEKDISYILKEVFRRGYNINKLVNKISNNKIGNYIAEVVTYGIDYEDISLYIRNLKSQSNNKFQKYLRDSLSKVIEMIGKRKEKFEKITQKFNTENKNVLKIEYTPISQTNVYFESFLRIFDNNSNKHSDYIEGTTLTWQEVQSYFEQLINKINYIELLDMLLNKRFTKLNKILDIKTIHEDEMDFGYVNRGLSSINEKNIQNIYKAIFQKVKNNRTLLEESIIKCFKVLDEFKLYFNIDNKEDVAPPKNIFRSVDQLSLGQQVAALLTFVFKFGALAHDNTPLLIDQPEDNLDNTYIYRTLVESLKCVKSTRQVIVVTHSSTIVTNADAEEVIVMKSNNRNGWIEKRGYPSEAVITKHIINYLEGGQESFRHKMDTYKIVIGN